MDYSASTLKVEFVSKSHSPGFVILSFIVCFIGSWTTMELAHKRTAINGWHNWSLLFGCSLSMGGMAVWCMHFIGNYAIILGEGDGMQAAYNPGITVFACLFPIIITGITFLVVALEDTFSYVRVGLGGTLAGLGFCGAYYAGQIHLSNYKCFYDLPFVIAAVLLSVTTNISAFGIYSWFRSTWSADWWLRGICSFLLSGAVSSMFWLSSSGTLYQMKTDVGPSPQGRTATIISVLVLSIVGCFVLLCTAVIKNATKLRTKQRARQIVLATAIFDCKGRLMVTPEGVLPNRKISGSYLEQDLNDTFNTSHPNFQWIMRTTYNWKGVKALVPAMRKHLIFTGLKTRFGAESDFRNDKGTPVKDYHLVFRELFCTAAADLADDLHQPLEKLGVMFDDIISTDQKPKQNRFMAEKRTSSVDLEKDNIELEAIGRGQLLFLVRRVDQHEADRLQGAGYRFADTVHLIPILGALFRIRRVDLQARLDDMYHYSAAKQILDQGVYFGLFCVRASIGSGFEILTQKSSRSLLPSMPITTDTLEEWQAELLKSLDGENVSTCLKEFYKMARDKSSPPIEKLFASQLRISLEQLRAEIADNLFNEAQLIGAPIQVPCRGRGESSPPSKALVFIFRLVTPLHARPPGMKLCYVPMTLFKTRQRVLKNSPDHAIFARRTYSEFASLLNLKSRPNTIDFLTPPTRPSHIPYFPVPKDLPPAVLNLKRKLLDQMRLGRRSKSLEQDISRTVSSKHSIHYGGIMVMSEVSVDNVHRKALHQPEARSVKLETEEEPLSEFGDTQGIVSKDTFGNETAIDEEIIEYVDELLRLSMRLR